MDWLRKIFHRCSNHRFVFDIEYYIDTSYDEREESTEAICACTVCGKSWKEIYYGYGFLPQDFVEKHKGWKCL